MSGDILLVERLIGRFPELRDLYECHVFNNGELLPHVFFWDVVQDVLAAYLGRSSDLPEWRPVLDFLEEEYRRGDDCGREVIVTSFLDSLPYPGQEAHEIVAHLGPDLAAVLMRLRL